MMTLEDALEKAKRFIAKMKGLDIELGGRPLIDYLDFTIVETDENINFYVLSVELTSNLYSPNRVTYRVDVNKETGNVDDIKRIKEE